MVKGASDRETVAAPPGLSIIRPLGRGAMASVYLARDTDLGRLVAIKVLNNALAADSRSRRRFEREAQAAARISHPNVSHVYSVGRLENDVPYICMEYVDGRNLADLIRSEGPLSIEQTLRILTQVADALAASHNQQVIHRDVKPANIIVENGTSRSVLTDFGIAGIRESGGGEVTRLTRAGETLGDPRYMSPEQHRGETATEQTDVYGLGIVAYEMLTRGDPFGRDRNEDAAAAHLRRQPLDLGRMRPDLPQHLAETFRRCLAKKPEHRPGVNAVLNEMRRGDDDAPDGVSEEKSMLAAFVSELRRRRVYQTAVAYLAAMIVILEAADVILPATPVPSWVFPALVTVFLSGFPLVVVLAWLYDIRRGRISRTDDSAAGTTSRSMHLLQISGIAASVILAAVVGWWMLT